MKILVTGANGFVGGAIARHLAEDSRNTVYGAGRQRPATAAERVIPLVFDISEKDSFAALQTVGGLDTVIHAAGLAHRFSGAPDSEFESANVLGTRHVAEFACDAGVRRFILISSVSVYGDHGKKVVDEETVCRPEGGYARSKLAAEETARRIFETGKLLTLRLSTVVGPGDPGNLARLITQIKRGRFLNVGRGENRKTFVSVADVAAMVGSLLEIGAHGVFNVAAEPISVREMLDAVYDAKGDRRPRFHIPASIPLTAFRLTAKTLRSKALADAASLLDKWLADNIYSGVRLRDAYGVCPKKSVIDEIRAEAAAIFKRQ
jgi:UDP-glucose 4-epimerase